LDSSDIEDGKVTVDLQLENAEIEGRIRYEGFDSWSAWISADQPVSRTTLETLRNLIQYFIFMFRAVKKERKKIKIWQNISLVAFFAFSF
jgi:hypothetical protein